MSKAGKLRCKVGIAPEVPRNVTRMLILFILNFFEDGDFPRQTPMHIAEMRFNMLVALGCAKVRKLYCFGRSYTNPLPFAQ